MNTTFFANGKLLLTGEYLVLEGCMSLALPCAFGQSLQVSTHREQGVLHWKSYDSEKKVWFEATFSESFSILYQTDADTAKTLQRLLRKATALNPTFSVNGLLIETYLDFPRDWGLGSSSTLVVLVGKLFDVSPYALQFEIFGGSAYDIACGMVDTPIFYQLDNGNPKVSEAPFDPVFKDKIAFVHLNKKQNSRSAISAFRAKVASKGIDKAISRVTEISYALSKCSNFEDFQLLLKEHEQILSEVLDMPTVGSLFPTFEGELKSLGAWGGDFMMATGKNIDYIKTFFKQKGFSTVIPYEKMVKVIKK